MAMSFQPHNVPSFRALPNFLRVSNLQKASNPRIPRSTVLETDLLYYAASIFPSRINSYYGDSYQDGSPMSEMGPLSPDVVATLSAGGCYLCGWPTGSPCRLVFNKADARWQGVVPADFSFDHPTNLMWLCPNHKRSYKARAWTFVPCMEDLAEMQRAGAEDEDSQSRKLPPTHGPLTVEFIRGGAPFIVLYPPRSGKDFPVIFSTNEPVEFTSEELEDLRLNRPAWYAKAISTQSYNVPPLENHTLDRALVLFMAQRSLERAIGPSRRKELSRTLSEIIDRFYPTDDSVTSV